MTTVEKEKTGNYCQQGKFLHLQNYELKKAVAGYEATALSKNQLKIKTNRIYIVLNFFYLDIPILMP
jgi:hypothetical protein